MAAIFIRTFIIYVLISLALRVMGKRQIGELEISELVSTLLISEIAALPIADPDIPLLNAVIPLFLIVALEIVVSSLKNRSERLKSVIEGEPIFLIYKGRLLQDMLKKNRLSVNELLCEARLQGIGELDEIYHAILEQNGHISLIKRDTGGGIAEPLVIDGEIKEANAKRHGFGKEDLAKAAADEGLRLDDVFLMTLGRDRLPKIIRKEGEGDDDENSLCNSRDTARCRDNKLRADSSRRRRNVRRGGR